MISFAQNCEDVILWRALKHVKKGCYIDIGAWDPVVDSVSMFFYTQGWRGIHAEPNPFYAKKLRHWNCKNQSKNSCQKKGNQLGRICKQ